MRKVGMVELRKDFSKLVERAGRGEVIGITKNGKLVAALRPANTEGIEAGELFENAKNLGVGMKSRKA